MERRASTSFIALVMIGVAAIGVALGRWSGPAPAIASPPAPSTNEVVPAGASKPTGSLLQQALAQIPVEPSKPARRREAVIELPMGTYAKEIKVPPYGSGKVVWTYEEDRVYGRIQVSALGFDVEMETDADISMTRHGTVYGVINGIKFTKVNIPPNLGPGGGPNNSLAELAPLWPLAEPLVAETLMDLPFSYQCRQNGNELVISSFRTLLAGPNPLGKVGGLMGGNGDNPLQILAYFQVISVAMEGTYTRIDGDAPGMRPIAPAHFRSPSRR